MAFRNTNETKRNGNIQRTKRNRKCVRKNAKHIEEAITQWPNEKFTHRSKKQKIQTDIRVLKNSYNRKIVKRNAFANPYKSSQSDCQCCWYSIVPQSQYRNQMTTANIFSDPFVCLYRCVCMHIFCYSVVFSPSSSVFKFVSFFNFFPSKLMILQ